MSFKGVKVLTKTRKPTSEIMSKTKTRDMIHVIVRDNIQEVFNFRYEEKRAAIYKFFNKKAEEYAAENKQIVNVELFTTLLNNVLFSKIKEYAAYAGLEDIPNNIIPDDAPINSIQHFINGTHKFIQNLINVEGVKKYNICTNVIKMWLKDGTIIIAEALANNKYKYVVTDANQKVLFNTKW
jgi:hypothetical protein